MVLVCLQPFDSEISCSFITIFSPSERDLPMLIDATVSSSRLVSSFGIQLMGDQPDSTTHPVVRYLALLVVLQVERVHVESVHQQTTVSDVECRAIKVDL